jgi:hypothetical protein
MKTLLILASMSLLIFFSCKSTENNSSQITTSGNAPMPGKYDFYMYDSVGVLLLTGVMNMNVLPDNKLSGNYTFTTVFNDEFHGYHAMDGNFEGDYNAPEKRIFINTNPRIADANVFFYLDYTKNSLIGTWNYSVFRATINSKGTIRAFKKAS